MTDLERIIQMFDREEQEYTISNNEKETIIDTGIGMIGYYLHFRPDESFIKAGFAQE